MVKKSPDNLAKDAPEMDGPFKFGENNSPAERELKVRHIVSAMTEAGKIRDLRNRRQIAENLGRILSKRKDLLNLSELVVSAGISENPDPSRLGRFRILPGNKVDRASVRRLSQEALAYVRLVKEVAKITEEDSSTLIEELVLGTKFDSSGLEGVEIEPFEQLHTLIQKKINALDAKFDLGTYFKNIRKHSLLPIWSHGPKLGGRIASHHSSDRPQIVGWKKEPNQSQYDDWQFEVMPCVSLCRLKTKVRFSSSIRSGEYKDADGFLQLYKRVYLAIGMFDTEYATDLPGEWVKFKDTSPLPYLILADEFHYRPGDENFSSYSRHHTFKSTLAGGVEDQHNAPYFFYDDRAEIEVESMESYYFTEPGSETGGDRFWGWPLNQFERADRLDLVEFRQLFGMPMSYEDGSFRFDKVETFLKHDALTTNELTMTLAPRGTLAELMESNLMSSSSANGGKNQEFIPNFLDKLEEDARIMTSSFDKFMEEAQSNLNKKHESLLEKIDREYEEAKVKE